MGSADKKARKKRTRKITKPNPSSGPIPQNSLLKTEQEEIQELENMMDADTDSDPPVPPISKGRNPYLTETCLMCGCKRAESQETNREEQNGSVNQLPLWLCNTCRESGDDEDKKAATTVASLLVSMERDLKLDSACMPSLEPAVSWSSSTSSSSEPTTPNGTLCNCEACSERRQIESEEEKESAELMKVWQELRHVVRCVYREAGTGLSQGADDSMSLLDTKKMKELVHRLVIKDAHQLFQRLESQGREYVIEMKVRLLKQLTAGHKTPTQAKQFVSMLLDEYSNLCAAAKTLAAFLTELMDHLKRFNLTWELHNKHLFQSIIYTDPVVQNSLPMLITQLRLGAASKEAYHEDTYPNILHRYLKYDDEMSVISVVWRECEQLIETYNDEQTALKAKQKMLKEDWEFFKAQRKLLEEKVLNTTQTTLSSAANNNDSTHVLDAQLSETMRSIFKGTKAGDDCLCPNCNRKRCPCDECSISHMITCGIINPEVAEQLPVHTTSSLPAFQHDARYVIDVSPPSMSSTSSSDGSESPITVHPERLNMFPFEENFRLAEEIPEEIDKRSDSADSDDDSTDEGDEDSDELVAKGERQQGDGQEKDDDTLSSESTKNQDRPCDCHNCAQQKILDKQLEEQGSGEQCQCHACLQQSGVHALTASLPHHHVLPPPPPMSPRRPAAPAAAAAAAAFHLYPHIHGASTLPQPVPAPAALQEVGHNVMRPSILQPQLYELHGVNPTMSTPQTSTETAKSFMPRKSDLDTTWDWDPTSKLLFGGGQKYSGTIGSELFNVSTPPLLTGNPFMSDLSGVGVNLMKTSTVLQQCVSASKPLTTTTVTTSTGITTSVTGLKQDSVNNAFTDAHNKILKVSKALLKQQQQKQQQQNGRGSQARTATTTTTTTVSHPVSCTQSLSSPASTAFTFGLPPSPNKNQLPSPPPPSGGLGAFSAPTSISSFAAAASNLQSSLSLTSSTTTTQSDFCFKHPFTSQTSAFSCPQLSSPNAGIPSMTSSPPGGVPMPSSSSSSSSANNMQHQLKLNPDFIRAAAALQKAISEQNQQQQQQQHGLQPGAGFQAFQNHNLQNLNTSVHQAMPNLNLLTCTHQLTHSTGSGGVMQVAGSTVMQASTGNTNTATPLGMAATSLKQLTTSTSHMTLPTSSVPHGQAASSPAHLPLSAGCEGHCDGNHDDDSIDDSCSEKSSSTSTSNQKDGKYCDCCYCEFFGQSTPPTVPQSRNLEMRERLRKRLKKKNEQKQSPDVQCERAEKTKPAGICRNETSSHTPAAAVAAKTAPAATLHGHASMGCKDLDELLKFINGSESGEVDKKSTKSAKRARQKQRKAEEKAKKEELAELKKKRELDQKRISDFNEQAKKLQEDLNRSRAKQIEAQRAQELEEAKNKESKANSNKKSEGPAQGKKKGKQKERERSAANENKSVSSASDVTTGKPAAGDGKTNAKNAKEKVKVDNKLLTAKQTQQSKVNTSQAAVNAGPKQVVTKNAAPTTTKSASITNVKVGHAVTVPARTGVKQQVKVNAPSPSVSSDGLSINTASIDIMDFGAKPLLNGDIPSSVSASISRVKVKRGPKSSASGVKSPRPGSAVLPNETTMLPSPPPLLSENSMASNVTLNINLPQSGNVQVANNKTSSMSQDHKASSSVHAHNQTNIQMCRQQQQPWPAMKAAPTPAHSLLPTNKSPPASGANLSAPGKPCTVVTVPVTSPACPVRSARPNRPILHAARTLPHRQKTPLVAKSILQVPVINQSAPIRIPLPQGTSSAPATPDQGNQRRTNGHGIEPSSETSVQLNFEQRSVPSTPTKQRPAVEPRVSIQGKSRSEGSLSNSAPTTPRKDEQGSGRNRKNRKKNKNGDELTSVDEIFLPKEETDLHPDMDEFEREIEEFKRFCLDSTPVGNREKIQVNVNLKDIFSGKKKGGVAY